MTDIWRVHPYREGNTRTVSIFMKLFAEKHGLSFNAELLSNRKKDKLKILHWDHNGFWLFYRRLEEGLFDWPNEATTPLKISGRQFKWLLEGLPMHQKSSHMKVSAKVVT